MPNVVISMDVEADLPAHVKKQFKGLEIIEPLLDVVAGLDIRCDFFVSGDVAIECPEIVKKLASRHNVGSHSLSHAMMKNMSYDEQYSDIAKSTDIIKSVIGEKPIMFRAPNFGINRDTIKVLDELGYKIDSSVMPGRIVKRFRHDMILYKCMPFMRDIDFSKESVVPHRIEQTGVWEVPLTENVNSRNRPLGMGYLNAFGLEKTLDAFNKTKLSHIMFLMHPWELIDFQTHYPHVPEAYRRICKPNMSIFEEMLRKLLNQGYGFTTVEDVVEHEKAKPTTK